MAAIATRGVPLPSIPPDRRTAGSTMNSEVIHFPMPNVQNPPFAKFCKFAQSINKSNLTLHQFVCAACARNNQNNGPKLDQTHPMWKACSLWQTQRVNSMRLQNGRCRTPAARVRSLCERHVQPTHTAPLCMAAMRLCGCSYSTQCATRTFAPCITLRASRTNIAAVVRALLTDR